MPEAVDLVVDRRVLLDVGVAGGDVGLGLVVVVVGHEILDPVAREELAELVGQLGGEGLVGRQHDGGPLESGDHVLVVQLAIVLQCLGFQLFAFLVHQDELVLSAHVAVVEGRQQLDGSLHFPGVDALEDDVDLRLAGQIGVLTLRLFQGLVLGQGLVEGGLLRCRRLGGAPLGQVEPAQLVDGIHYLREPPRFFDPFLLDQQIRKPLWLNAP